MTEALERSVSKARLLSEDEQNHLAALIEGEYEQIEWRHLVESPQSLAMLDKLAERAWERERKGETTPLRDLL